MPIKVADNGSSFASPYVATAAWIRMLQGLGANFIKRSLVAASLPVPEVGSRVESGGLFDPALLLSAPGAHLVTADGAVLPVTALTLSLKSQKNEIEAAEITGSLKASPTHLVTLHQCGPNVCAIVRGFSQAGDVELTAGQVVSMSVHAVAGQRTFDEKDPAAILARIKTISF